MARTRGTARKGPGGVFNPHPISNENLQEPEQTEDQSVEPVSAPVSVPVAYSKMGVADLKKLLEERKIDGRSKLAKKEAMIKVLELYDQDPEDKKAISALILDIGKSKSKGSSSKSKEEQTPDAEIIIDVPQSNETTKKESKKPKKEPEAVLRTMAEETKKPKKEPKKEDWLLAEGISREDYPPGTRFTKSKVGGKIHVHYPKSHMENDESETEEPKKSVSTKKLKEEPQTELKEPEKEEEPELKEEPEPEKEEEPKPKEEPEKEEEPELKEEPEKEEEPKPKEEPQLRSRNLNLNLKKKNLSSRNLKRKKNQS